MVVGNGDVALSGLVFLVAMFGSFFVVVVSTRRQHSPRTKSGYKKSASFPTRLGLGFVVVLSWIFPWFVT